MRGLEWKTALVRGSAEESAFRSAGVVNGTVWKFSQDSTSSGVDLGVGESVGVKPVVRRAAEMVAHR